MWCWRRLLRVPWTARRSNQSILKEISPEYWLEGLMLKLKLQYFGHLMQRTDSLEKTLMLGKFEGRRRGWQRMRWLDGITDSMDMSLSNSRSWWWTGRPGGSAVHEITKSRTRMSDWTETSRENLRTLLLGFPCGSVVKHPPASIGDTGSTPGSGRSFGRKWQPTPESSWEIPWTEESGEL